ncbi:DUF383-domain-containing protein [Terfezia boudieri ATCC MYA-4762]|uniref:DUF383-domain-containing protein n=1 Tax=Terfezia boudieri ATCC MYA-4762 TaxID=1051890 RepID=A0A3N4LL27_9PEZI|nr:DUF383-domain-containing protein [Terfezia boudieri ATCC MYA-4762]
MPTELEELVGFLGAPQPHIRQIALENVIGYSAHQPAIFKTEGLKPVKDLKALVGSTVANTKNALTCLVNLSSDPNVLNLLAADITFIGLLLKLITTPLPVPPNAPKDLRKPPEAPPAAELGSMLLANLAKHDTFPAKILEMKKSKIEGISQGEMAMDQLMDCFVRGEKDWDYLAYVFADVSRIPQGRKYFITPRSYDSVIPMSKLVVFTEHPSDLRRRGIASTIKNACFDLPTHSSFLSPTQINLLPYLLSPLMGPEEYPEDEMSKLPEDLQLLPPTKKREPEVDILTTHVESILLLATARSGREVLRDSGVYPVLREAHLAVKDEGFRDTIDRVVQVLMADEDPHDPDPEARVLEVEVDEDSDKVIEIL